jgi:hypothetical protein
MAGMKLALGFAFASVPLAALAQTPPRMEAPQAVIFTAKPGESVTAGETKLKDGERIIYIGDDGMIGSGTDAVATITKTKGGTTMTLPNVNVLTEERITRSADGAWAVFTAIRTCGDYCYADVWLIGAKTRVKLSGEAHPDVVTAFTPDGKRLAVGSRGIFLVDLANPRPQEFSTVTSPSWGPDGALWARGAADDDAAYRFDGGTWKRVVKLAGRAPSPEPGADPGDPAPVRFEDGGNVLVVEFERGNYTWEVRANAAGKLLKKKRL